MDCNGYRFEVEYFENGIVDEKNIKIDLFSDEAERVVECFLRQNVNNDFKEKRGRRQLVKKLSSTQIRKFYEEVLNLKQRIDNGEDFRKVLPYFKMLKAKANVAYERDVVNTNFKTFIEKNVDYVTSGNLEEIKEKFKVFCTFFEAVVAYAKGRIKD